MDPRAGLVGLLCVLVLVVPFALWIGSLILRAAIGLTNRVLGGANPSDLDFSDASWDYRHGRYPQAPTRSGLAIPVPSSGRAMGILLLIGVVDFVARLGLMMAAGVGGAMDAQGANGGTGQAMAALIGLPVSFVIHIAMLSSLLPTSLGRACLVVVFQFLILMLIAMLIGVAIVVLMAGHAGTR